MACSKKDKKCRSKEKEAVKADGKKRKMTRAEITRIHDFLKIVRKLKQNDFSTLVTYLSDEACEAMGKCVKNSICSQHINEKTRSKIRRALWNNKNDMRFIASKTNASSIRTRLPKIGGSISLIIGAVLPILVDLLTKTFRRKK